MGILMLVNTVMLLSLVLSCKCTHSRPSRTTYLHHTHSSRTHTHDCTRPSNSLVVRWTWRVISTTASRLAPPPFRRRVFVGVALAKSSPFTAVWTATSYTYTFLTHAHTITHFLLTTSSCAGLITSSQQRRGSSRPPAFQTFSVHER